VFVSFLSPAACAKGSTKIVHVPAPRRPLRLSATVTPKFFLLYHFFPLFSPLFFHLSQRFPLNTPPIPHYHYKISFSISTINFLSTNNYSWTHSTVFRVMNSDTLNLGGERRGPVRRGRCRGTAAAVECPLQPPCGYVRLGRDWPGSSPNPRGSPRRGLNPGPWWKSRSFHPRRGPAPACSRRNLSPRPGICPTSEKAWNGSPTGIEWEPRDQLIPRVDLIILGIGPPVTEHSLRVMDANQVCSVCLLC
jgi:hypothetical protein